MNVVAIVQARVGSTRLPRKVMKKLGDHTVLGHVINRCKAIPSVDGVIVATTLLQQDNEILEEAQKYGVDVYRGSEKNVLSRYYEAALKAQADIVVRITSDCPLLDPQISNEVIVDFISKNVDYSSTGLTASFPRGLDTEVFTFSALERAFNKASKDYEFEHVTPYIYQHPNEFRIHSYANQQDHSNYRLTLDTLEDWLLISQIYNKLYRGDIFYWKDVYQLLIQQPHLIELNSHVKQKQLGE